MIFVVMFNYKKGQRYIHVSQLIVFPYFFISFYFVEPQIETILGGGRKQKTHSGTKRLVYICYSFIHQYFIPCKFCKCWKLNKCINLSRRKQSTLFIYFNTGFYLREKPDHHIGTSKYIIFNFLSSLKLVDIAWVLQSLPAYKCNSTGNMN